LATALLVAAPPYRVHCSVIASQTVGQMLLLLLLLLQAAPPYRVQCNCVTRAAHTTNVEPSLRCVEWNELKRTIRR